MNRLKKSISVIALALLALALATRPNVFAAPPTQTTNAWYGTYFNNRNLQGNPVWTREDPNVDFSWGNGSPGANIPPKDFSVRWTRWLYIDTPGNWTFTTIVDDGVRLYIDDTLVIDAWNEQALTTRIVTLNLTQSFHLVRMEYFNHTGNAQAHLYVTSANYPDWRGEYFSNPDLTGAPAFVRNDPSIRFDFGNAGPGGNVPGTNFSTRWTRSQFFAGGRYRFTTTTDDGVRLWIDGQAVIDQWHDQNPKSWTADVELTEGNHWLRMDHFQHGGNAQAQLSWTLVTGSAEIWRAEFFDNPSVTGTLVFSRDDTNLNFNWGTDSPGKGLSKNGNWSVRWTSKRTANLAGFYTVTAIADDGVRVWVDNNLLIDQWHDQSPTAYGGMTFLTAGQHDWRVEYYQHGGKASLRVEITPGAIFPDQLDAQAPPPTGDVAIDTKNAWFIHNMDGNWKTTANGYGGQAYWTANNTFAQAHSNWVRWYATVAHAGKYEVFAYIPGSMGTTRSARYIIAHSGSSDVRSLNQSIYSNQWVSLGTFDFAGTGDEYVSLSDVTYEPTLATVVVADTVMFSPR